jgi:hypothetical protein
MPFRLALLAVLVLLGGSVHAADHTVDLTIHAVSGSIGWHFSRYDGPVRCTRIRAVRGLVERAEEGWERGVLGPVVCSVIHA